MSLYIITTYATDSRRRVIPGENKGQCSYLMFCSTIYRLLILTYYACRLCGWLYFRQFVYCSTAGNVPSADVFCDHRAGIYILMKSQHRDGRGLILYWMSTARTIDSTRKTRKHIDQSVHSTSQKMLIYDHKALFWGGR